jgi:predicted nucleotidyltransferase
MLISYGIDEEIRKKIVGLLQVLFPGAKIYLYGSRARGTFHDRSDIDLAIDVGPGHERLRLGEAKAVLDAASIYYKVDLVDLNHISKELHENIERDKVLWN